MHNGGGKRGRVGSGASDIEKCGLCLSDTQTPNPPNGCMDDGGLRDVPHADRPEGEKESGDFQA